VASCQRAHGNGPAATFPCRGRPGIAGPTPPCRPCGKVEEPAPRPSRSWGRKPHRSRPLTLAVLAPCGPSVTLGGDSRELALIRQPAFRLALRRNPVGDSWNKNRSARLDFDLALSVAPTRHFASRAEQLIADQRTVWNREVNFDLPSSTFGTRQTAARWVVTKRFFFAFFRFVDRRRRALRT
jgi:hypothetical protein